MGEGIAYAFTWLRLSNLSRGHPNFKGVKDLERGRVGTAHHNGGSHSVRLVGR